MTQERIRHDQSVKGIEKALETLAARKPAFETIVDAFGPLLLAKAAFKESYSLPDNLNTESLPFDENRFSQGEPLFTSIGLMDFHEDLTLAAQALLPPMKKTFKGIGQEIEKIEKGILTPGFDARECVRDFLDHPDALKKQADEMDVPVDIFKFVLGQLIKPFMEIQAPVFAALTEGHQWLHGYCPVCGSNAAMAGLAGEGGKRWLQCANCAHEWRFNRHTCPGCDDKDHTHHEYFFDENSPVKAGERVDVCKACNTYILTMDLRQKNDPFNMEVAAMGMVALDLLAQEKGFSPLAATPWNCLK